MNIDIGRHKAICRCGSRMNILSSDVYLECECPDCGSSFKVPIDKTIRGTFYRDRDIEDKLETGAYWTPATKTKPHIVNKMKVSEDYLQVGDLSLVFDVGDTREGYSCPLEQDWIEIPQGRTTEEMPLKIYAQVLEVIELDDGFPVFNKEIDNYGTNKANDSMDDLRWWIITDMGDNKVEDFD